MENRFVSRATASVVVLCMIAAAFSFLMVGSPAVCGASYPAAATIKDGNVSAENFGKSVVLMDLNHDGIADLVVGAPLNDPDGMLDAGSVTLYLSESGVPMSRIVLVNGTNAGDLFGFCVANAGDLNGDGHADLAIGAPFASPNGHLNAGNVTIVFGGPSFTGRPGAWINSSSDDELFGCSLAAGGDINRDGYGDLIVGAPFATARGMTGAGRVDVYYGGSPMNAVADKTFFGEVADAHFGWSVSGNASVDGDTSLDLVVGAPGHRVGLSATGAAYVIRNIIKANPNVNLATGKANGDEFGFAVAMIQDMNADSYAEVAVGAPHNDDNGTDAGSVSIMYGSNKFNTFADLTLKGAPGEHFGTSVAGGNFREDAYTDVIVGAPNSALNASRIGRAYGFFGGNPPDANPDLILVPGTDAVAFGWSIAVGGNATGDRAPDIAVGDPQFTVGSFTAAGRVYVFAGALVTPPPSLPIVTGFVRVPGTTTGLSGFTVTLGNGTSEWSDLTAPDGSYSITAVPGTYWLNTSRAGYVSNSTDTFTLVMGETKTIDTIYPLTIPRVTGHVLDDMTSAVISGARVALYNGSTLLDVMTTPANGSYWMYVPDEFVPPATGSIDLRVEAWDPTHYTRDRDFTLMRNESLHLDMSLDTFPVVSGTVRDAITLSPVSGAVVEVAQGAVLGSAMTDRRGDYSVVATNATVPGTLFINVTAAGYYKNGTTIAALRNGTYTHNFFLQIDNQPPTSSLAVLPTYTTQEIVTLAATASDSNGIAFVELWYRFNETGAYKYFGSESSSPYVFEFNTSLEDGDGLYEFYSQAVDFADLNESPPGGNDTWTIVDTNEPVATLSSLPVFTTTETVTLDATASDDDGVDEVQLWYRYDETGAFEYFGSDLTQPYSFDFDTSLMSGDGLYEFYVLAVDGAGNNKTPPAGNETWTIVDTVRPVVSLASLPAHTSTADFTVTATASDANGVANVSLYIRKNGSAYSMVSKLTSAPYSWTIQTASWGGEGAFDFYALATDWAGNTRNVPPSPDASTYVDTSAPALRIVSPANNTLTAEPTVVVTWNGSDSGSGIQMYEVRIDSGAWMNLGLNTSHTFTGLLSGSHRVAVNATDNVSMTTTESVVFVVDDTPPDVTITSPILGSVLKTADVTVTWTATDAHTRVDRVEVAIDGGAFEEVGNATSATFYDLENGEHDVTVRVWDGVGNHEDATIGFEVKVKGDTGNTTMILAGVGILAAVVVVALAALLMRKRGAKPPEEGPEGKGVERSE